MRDKIASVIMSIVIILIMVVFGIFGVIFWEEIQSMQTSIEPEGVQTIISSSENIISKDIKTPEIVENPLDKIKDSSDMQEVDYSKVNVDNYFYNQLEEASQTIYKAFEANKENMKTGTYKIELGSTFTSILNKSNGQEELGKYYQSAIESYTYDNPEIFYLSPNKMYLNIETTTINTTTTYYVYINNGNEANYLADEFSSRAQVDQAIAKIEQVKNRLVQNRSGNTYQDIKMVHDYLIDNVSYDTSISKPNIYNVYGALVNGEAVCEGYARAFKYIMDEMGIPCTLVIGKGTNSEGTTENHAWNYVQLNGNWYAIDATWDDPVIIGGGTLSQSSKYKYFLKGSNEMSKDHTPSGQFTEGGKVFNYPVLSNENYN